MTRNVHVSSLTFPIPVAHAQFTIAYARAFFGRMPKGCVR